MHSIKAGDMNPCGRIWLVSPEYCINIHMSTQHLPQNACRTCGATNYRRVVERDAQGKLRSTGLYQCSGCSVVFADPKAWRDGGADTAMPNSARCAAPRPAEVSTSSGSASNRRSGAIGPDQAHGP
jgi:hypothetical protein